MMRPMWGEENCYANCSVRSDNRVLDTALSNWFPGYDSMLMLGPPRVKKKQK